MAMLSKKTAQEISWMLDDYGIKHGPVVDSTRALYEKKLREAMAKGRKNKPSSDKTFYSEEEEDVTYIHHRRPLKQKNFEGRSDLDLRSDYAELYSIHESIAFRTQTAYGNPSQPTVAKYKTQHEASQERPSGHFVPLWLQILLFFIVAGVLVFVFMNMESARTEPFKRLT